jgi:hypothetical protein
VRRALLAAALALTPALARAGLASTGAQVLRRPLTARQAALGAFAAGTGLDAFGANPAGLAALKRPAAVSTFHSGVADDTFGFLGGAVPLKRAVAAAGLTYYDAGKVDIVALDGTQSSRVAEQDYVGTGGAALDLGEGLSVGALGKFYRLSLAEEAHANGFAADLGAQWAPPVRGLRLGVSVLNAGPGVKFESATDPLPLTERAGAAWTLETRPADPASTYYSASRLTLSADQVQVRGEGAALAVGGEFGLDVGAATSLAVRLGSAFGATSDRISFGVGVREGRFVADYALAAKKDLGEVHFVSLGARF